MVRASSGILVGALLSGLLLSACGTVDHRFRSELPARSPAEKIPMTLALVLPPSVCSHAPVYGEFRPSVYHVGETLCRDIRKSAERTYRSVRVFGTKGEALAQDADAVLAVRIVDGQWYVLRKIPVLVRYRLTLEWSFATRDGKSSYLRRLVGIGEDQRTFGMPDPRHRAALQRCIGAMERKVSAEMAAAPENGRRNIAAEKDILGKFGRYAAGVTSLDRYEKDQTGDWKVTGKERFVRSEKMPGKDGKALVGKTEVYVKDEVRSAFGDGLVCVLEFRGSGGKGVEIMLSSVRCSRNDAPVLSR